MSLTTAIKNGPPPLRKGPACGLGRIIAQLDGENLAALYLMLDNPDWTGADIARALTDEGHDMKPAAVARHRRGECKCDPL